MTHLELEPADAEVVKQALSWFMGDVEKYLHGPVTNFLRLIRELYETAAKL